MEDNFLNSLYKEEETIYNKIVAQSLYDDLLEIQRWIIRKGGNPKYNFGIKSTPTHFNQTSLDISQMVAVNAYEKKWSWEEKTKFAFNIIGGRSTPKEIIDLLFNYELFEHDGASKETISSNVYNVIHKLKKTENLILDGDSSKRNPVYILINEESLLKSKDS